MERGAGEEKRNDNSQERRESADATLIQNLCIGCSEWIS